MKQKIKIKSLHKLTSLLLFVSLSFIKPLSAQQKRVCFSIDDLPVVNYGKNTPKFHNDVTDKLLTGLKMQKIQAIGFVNEGKMYKAGKVIPFQKENLNKWLKYGMDLGNHTLRHKDINNVDFNTYTAEIIAGEKISKALLRNHYKKMKYFRHPFLHVGATKGRADSLEVFLEKHHYVAAPVTIDNEDYIFAKAYQIALTKKDTVLAQTIGKDYIIYMEQKIHFYEKMSQSLFDRQIPQILLIHANLLNADYIEKLAEIYIKNGYAFATIDETMKDSAYKTPISKFGRYGISWLDRWALSQGKKGDFFTGDPETPKYIAELSGQE